MCEGKQGSDQPLGGVPEFDGLWVLQTNTDFEPSQIATRYKALWMVEQVFRTSKALLDMRPIFHKCDETIRGHIFCSFLALVLQSELHRRMQAAGTEAEWADIRRDLNALTETEIEQDGKRFLVRSATQGSIVAILRCAGARLPQTIRQIETAEMGKRCRRPNDMRRSPELQVNS